MIVLRVAPRVELFKHAANQAFRPVSREAQPEVQRRKDWVEWVNQPQTNAEMMAVFHAIKHNRPYGSERWTAKIEKRLGVGPLRERGRPKIEQRSDE